jgi:hypothetical protein
MRRQPSIALRVLRSLVVLVTVWCTGCSGFEPVLEATLGRSNTGMLCASEEQGLSAETEVPAAGAASVGSRTTAAAISALPMSSTEQGFSCGCASCHSVTLASWSFTPIPLAALPPVVATQSAWVSVGRVPLLPPPERTVA